MAPIHNSLLTLATLATFSDARPTFPWWPIKTLTTPAALPLKELSSQGTLPTPSTSPKYILLGLGFQNYTCSSASLTWVQSTVQAGAIADLSDITSFVTSNSQDTYTVAALKSFENCLTMTKCSPTEANGYCSACHTLSTTNVGGALNRMGEHFFDQISGSQLPNFNVWGHGDFFSGKKGGNAKAPSKAYKGSNGLGTVDWLYLVDNGCGRTTDGLTSIYRVETAGGVAPSSCDSSTPVMQVPYAAEYYVYGS